MYVVRRELRGSTGYISAGSVIEPADVRNLAYLIRSKYVVEVDEHNYDEYAAFFKRRFGKTIPELPVDTEADLKADLMARMDVIPRDIALECFDFPEGDATSITTVQAAVEKAEEIAKTKPVVTVKAAVKAQ